MNSDIETKRLETLLTEVKCLEEKYLKYPDNSECKKISDEQTDEYASLSDFDKEIYSEHDLETKNSTNDFFSVKENIFVKIQREINEILKKLTDRQKADVT